MKRALMIPTLTLGALALAACANDKPATDASSATTTTSARAPDGLMSTNPNDTNATGAATNESPKNQPGVDAQGHALPTTPSGQSAGMKGQGLAGSSGSGGSGGWTDNNLSNTTTTTDNKSSGGPSASNAQPAPGTNGNAAGASQPGVIAPPPPAGGSPLTPMDQGNNPTDLKITQQIRKAVVGDSSLSFTAKNVKIITIGGKVTLRGQVKSDAERRAIEASAFKVVGNTNVDDQIQVKP